MRPKTPRPHAGKSRPHAGKSHSHEGQSHGGKPHRGKPHDGKPHGGKAAGSKSWSDKKEQRPYYSKSASKPGDRTDRPANKPPYPQDKHPRAKGKDAYAQDKHPRPPGKHPRAKGKYPHDTLNRAPGKHPRPEYAKDKNSRPAATPAYTKHARPAGKPYNPGPDTRPQRTERGDRPAKQENWLYGLHAVTAALANPNRKLGRVVLTPRVLGLIDPELLDGMRVETMELGAIDKLLPPGAVHQGAALEAAPLPQVDFEALLTAPSAGRRVVLVLDQLSDPHNVGAILRSAAAFGVTAVVVQDRHAPPQSGALAKAASGALDTVPYVEVVNIARALEKLGERGFWRIALAGNGDKTLAQAVPDGDVALVMGSEGDGIRRLVRENCDVAANIAIDGAMESLNVSNAAAIALYELRR